MLDACTGDAAGVRCPGGQPVDGEQGLDRRAGAVIWEDGYAVVVFVLLPVSKMLLGHHMDWHGLRIPQWYCLHWYSFTHFGYC